MDFSLSAEQTQITEMVAEFVDEEVVPVADEIDAADEFPAELIEVGELLDQVPRELVVGVDFVGDGNHLLVDEVRHHLRYLLLLGGEAEIHVRGIRPAPLYASPPALSRTAR